MRPRWRRPAPGELETWRHRLVHATGPDGTPGAVRHMFALSCMDARGVDVLRVVQDGGSGWALAVVHPGRLVVPCGDGDLVREAGSPTRRWRLLVGDADPSDALLTGPRAPADMIVHHQRFMVVDEARVPSEAEVAPAGLRRAESADLDRLAELALRLHVDDQFGPDPGRAALRGYRDRVATSVDEGLVWVVGPVGEPVAKVERSVSSWTWGVQLAGIVVDPAARGQGLGTAMVAEAVRGAIAEGPRGRAISLHVRAANLPAIRAYTRAGYVDREEWRLAVRP